MITHCLCIACLGRGYGPEGLEAPCALCHGQRRLMEIDPGAAAAVTNWATSHGLSHANDESQRRMTFPEGATYEQMEAVRRGERFVPHQVKPIVRSVVERITETFLLIADLELRLRKLEG